MKGEIIAGRYAQALFNLSKKYKSIEEIQQQFTIVTQAIVKQKEYGKFWLNPRISLKVKSDILRALKDTYEINEVLIRFLIFLLQKQRFNILEDIRQHYNTMVNQSAEKTSAVIVSGIEITEEQMTRIADILEKVTGKTVSLSRKIDPEIVGGIKIKIGNKFLDGTVMGRLTSLVNRP